MKRKVIVSHRADPPGHAMMIESCCLYKYRGQNTKHDMIFQKLKTNV